MFKHPILFLSATLLCLSATLLPAAHAQNAQTAPLLNTQNVTLSGQVVDANSGQPLQGVYIRQQDALNAIFSDTEGRFTLQLQTGFSPVVVFQVEGYEPVALPFSATQTRLKINLQPQVRYTPSNVPQAHTPETPAGEPNLFPSQFTAFYQANYTLFRQEDVSINGIVLNEWGISTDLQPFQSPLTFRGRFFRSRMPVDVANFPFQPAFFINHQQAKVGAGWTHKLDGPLELYLGGDVMLDSRSPDNRNNQDQQPVLFTGSLLDREQTRLGLGVNGALAWQFADRWTLYPEASVYPVMFNFVNAPGDPAYYTLAGDVGARLRFEIVPGAYAVAQYNTQLWYSFGPGALENKHYFHLGISIDPWTMAERLL